MSPFQGSMFSLILPRPDGLGYHIPRLRLSERPERPLYHSPGPQGWVELKKTLPSGSERPERPIYHSPGRQAWVESKKTLSPERAA